MSQDRSKIRALVAPLDWGIGHATRCVPVIRELVRSGCEVIIGTSGKSGIYLKNYFPELPHIDMPSLKIRFGTYHRFPWYMFQIFRFPFITIREHLFLKRCVTKLGLDLIISDNRYGLFHKKICSVLITHQLFIRFPGPFGPLQNMVRKMVWRMISRFDQCWIPDLADPQRSLSNSLSHGNVSLTNHRYIGFLSRFAAGSAKEPGGPASTRREKTAHDDRQFDLMVILSGPEPQRTIFEHILISQIRELRIKAVMFQGLPAEIRQKKVLDNMTIISHPDDKDFITFARQTDRIICRSGYSTIMDLVALGKRALLVPAPGQTEQVYLARHLSSKGWFLHMAQKDFNLKTALSLFEKKQFPGYPDSGTKNFGISETLKLLMDKTGRQ